MIGMRSLGIGCILSLDLRCSVVYTRVSTLFLTRDDHGDASAPAQAAAHCHWARCLSMAPWAMVSRPLQVQRLCNPWSGRVHFISRISSVTILKINRMAATLKISSGHSATASLSDSVTQSAETVWRQGPQNVHSHWPHTHSLRLVPEVQSINPKALYLSRL